MNKVLKKLEQFGIVPVVVLEDAKDAAFAGEKLLCDGGLACAEVTFRTAAAEESIRIMSPEVSGDGRRGRNRSDSRTG